MPSVAKRSADVLFSFFLWRYWEWEKTSMGWERTERLGMLTVAKEAPVYFLSVNLSRSSAP